MVATLLIAIPIAFAIYTLRRGVPQIRRVWAHASWWERCALLLLLVPIPGPVDEIVGALVLVRVSRRLASGR